MISHQSIQQSRRNDEKRPLSRVEGRRYVLCRLHRQAVRRRLHPFGNVDPQQAHRQPRGEGSELERQQTNQSVLEVRHEGGQPAGLRRAGHGGTVERLEVRERGDAHADENAGVLAREIVGRLTQVYGRVALLLVEVEQRLGQSEAHADPLALSPRPSTHMQTLALAVVQTHQQGR